MVFPLPLAAFEDYLLADDRPTCPMDFFVKLSFRGVLQRSVFQEAVDAAVDRHPLLRALIAPRGWRGNQWVAGELSRINVETQPPGSIETCSAIDLKRQAGLRVFLEECDEGSRVWLQFHHVCCDGLGALRVVEDVLACYDGLVRGTGDALLRPVDPMQLRRRDRFSDDRRGLLARARASIPRQWLGLLGAAEYFAHRPISLDSPVTQGRKADRAAGAFRCLDARRLSREETIALRQTAKRLDCTTNDILLWALYRAIDGWTTRHGLGASAGYVRIMIPTNLRGERDHAMPAANRVSMVFLDRRPSDFGSSLALVDSIAREMRRIKRHRLGLSLLSAIRLVRMFPGGIRRMLPENGCLSTTMLTNVLDPTAHFRLQRREGRIVAGEVVLENLEGFAPYRPKTPVSFAALFYAHRLNLCMNFDPRCLSGPLAEDLLDGFVERLHECIADGVSRVTCTSSGAPL